MIPDFNRDKELMILNEDVKTSGLAYQKIDTGLMPSLIKQMRQVLTEELSHKATIFTDEFWDWQYRSLPSRQAHVYVCAEAGDIVGYIHAPVYEWRGSGKEKYNFATIQDVAVAGKMRGRGVFRRLVEYACEDLKNCGVNASVTFPNVKSISAFEKYGGYAKISTHDSYLLPLRSNIILSEKYKLAGLEKAAAFGLCAYSKLRGGYTKPNLDVRLHAELDWENSRRFCSLSATADYRFVER